MTVRERLIASALSIAILGAVLFIVAYALGGDRLYEGLSAALCAAGLCAAATGWAFWILPPETVVDRRDDVPSAEPARTAETAELERGTAQLTRRTTLTRLVYVAFGVVAIALVVPLRSLGISSFSQMFAPTKWRKGERLAREDGSPVHVDDINVDSFLTVFPESAPQDAVSQTMLVRVPESIAPATRGLLAYSKICTHAGCPVALYRASTKQLMCPCHQSMFDVVNGGEVVSGPADHALPQLPLTIDDKGYVRAGGDFNGPVGPSFWQRST